MFFAALLRASLVESASTTGRPLRSWALMAMSTEVSVMPRLSFASVLPVQGAASNTSKSFPGPTCSASAMVRMGLRPVICSSSRRRSSAR